MISIKTKHTIWAIKFNSETWIWYSTLNIHPFNREYEQGYLQSRLEVNFEQNSLSQYDLLNDQSLVSHFELNAPFESPGKHDIIDEQ